MRTKKVVGSIVLALFCALLAASAVWAQVSTSSITGTVLDKTGAAVPSAKVAAVNEATGTKNESTTTTAGVYAFPSLIVGSYTISVEAQGFRKWVSTNNVLNVGAPIVVDVRLEVGALSSTVQVESTYERLDTSDAMLSDVVNQRAIQNLPLNGRNPLNLIVLQPGLIQRSNGNAGSGTHVNGSRDRAFNVTLDGIDINEPSVPNPQSNVFRLNTDNVQEYRIVTQNATAEYGRNSGANITLASRSGTNAFHGDLYEYFRNPVLNANEWFNNLQGNPKPNFKLHQYGADVGGPIFKNKTFFFASWQGQRLTFTQSISSAFGSTPLVYTPLARTGKFRYVVGTINGTTSNSSSLVDPNTGALLPGIQTCGGSVITDCIATFDFAAKDPAGVGVDTVMGAFVNSTPPPNSYRGSPGQDGLNVGGFVWNPPSSQPEARWLARIDHQFNENNSIFVRYTIAFSDTKQGDFLNNRPEVFPGFPPLGEVSRRPSNLAVSYRRVFSPRLVNEFTTGYSRFLFDFLFGRANPKFPNIPPFQPTNVTTPYLNQSGTARWLTTLQFIDNISYSFGNHFLRGGINFRFIQHNDQRSFVGGVNNAPAVSFSGSTRDPALIFTGGSALPATINSTDLGNLKNTINELLGLPSGETQAFFGSGLDGYTPSGLYVRGVRMHQYDFYIQDEWKWRRNVTFNVGLRYEYNEPGTEAGGQVLRPNRKIDGSQGLVTFLPRNAFWDRRNGMAFAPRIGIAWDPFSSGRMVIRAGYAIAFDTISTFQMVPILGLVPGSSAACSLSLSGGTPSITNNCPMPANAGARIASGFPLMLPQPLAPPSSFTSPAQQRSSTAPPAGTIDPNLQNPTVHEWNLSVQKELWKNVVLQTAYVGKRGTHLFRAYNLNQVSINHDGYIQSFIVARNNLIACGDPRGTTGCGQAVGILQSILGSSLNTSAFKNRLLSNAAGSLAALIDSNFFTQMVAVTSNPNFFRPNSQFGSIFYFDSGGDSYYHALQIQVKRHEPNLDFGASYTFGKATDDMSVDPVGATSSGAVGNNPRSPTDIHNFAADRGRADFDRTHVLSGYAVWNLPFGKGQRWAHSDSGFLNQIIGGWTTTGLLTYMTGEPFSVGSGQFTNSNIHASRADLVGPVPGTGVFFDIPGITGPTVFPSSVLPKTNLAGTPFGVPAPGSNGNQGRNIFNGPSFFNADLGIGKRFDLTERMKLVFRADFFNAFNHPNFDNPVGSTDGTPSAFSTTAGGAVTIVSPTGVLPLQLALVPNSNFGRSCCVAVSTQSSASVISIGEPPRVIQFALRLTF